MTYRGEGRLVDGRAQVALPAYFEALCRAEGRTVQLTPKVEGDEAPGVLGASDVRDGAFSVRAGTGCAVDAAFYWEVRAARADVAALEPEPLRPGAPAAVA